MSSYTSAEKCRKTKALLLLALLTLAEGRRVSARADNRFQAAGSARYGESLALARHDEGAFSARPKLQDQVMLVPEHIRVIMDDPGLLEQSKLVAVEIEALAMEPKVQKWRELATQSMAKLAESSYVKQHAELAANQLSAIMEETSNLLVEQSGPMSWGLNISDSSGEAQDLQQRGKVFSERMKVITEAPGFKERTSLLGEHIEAILKDPEVQDLAKAASQEFITITEDPEFMERVRLAAEQVGSIMEHAEAITAHLTFHQTGAGPASESFSLAEVERLRVSFLPSALKRRGHQSLSGTSSGIRSKMPSIISALPQRALPRRANGAEMSAGDVPTSAAARPGTRASRIVTMKASMQPSSPQQPDDAFFAVGVRTPQRTIGILALWLSLIGYVAIGAPGKDAAAQAADAELLGKLIANPLDPTVSPFFASIFSLMGIWPAWYASVLLPGASKQKPLPAAPSLVGSIAAGMFALSPYLALREARTNVTTAELNQLSKWTEGRLNAALLSLGSAIVIAFGLAGNGGDLARSAAEYAELFSSQFFVHVTSLDFLSLWVLSYGVICEDAKRRGLGCPSPLYAMAPIIGHCFWLLNRPPLPEE